MNNFDSFVPKIIEYEGGSRFTDDPDDPGRATKFGISIKFAGSIHLDINGDGKTDIADIIALTLEDAKEIYFEHFWSKIGGDLLPRGVAYIAFDGSVNQGPYAAIIDLQRSLRVKDDGIFGNETRTAAHFQYSAKLINEYCARRMTRYGSTRKFEKYGLGWSRRLFDVHNYGTILAQNDL